MKSGEIIAPRPSTNYLIFNLFENQIFLNQEAAHHSV